MRRRNLILAMGGATALAAAGGLGLVLSRREGAKARSVVASGEASIGGPFTLEDTGGEVFTDRNLLGKPSVVYFGFTYCPEVCPTTLTALSAWMKALGPDADKLNVVFITVDPERDTPKQLGLYLSSFDHRIRGLTGTPAQVAQAAKDYLVYYQKVTLDGGGYTMDHSTGLYLMDRQGHLQDLIAYQEPSDDALAKLRRLIGG